jgi:hypothetical protein
VSRRRKGVHSSVRRSPVSHVNGTTPTQRSTAPSFGDIEDGGGDRKLHLQAIMEAFGKTERRTRGSPSTRRPTTWRQSRSCRLPCVSHSPSRRSTRWVVSCGGVWLGTANIRQHFPLSVSRICQRRCPELEKHGLYLFSDFAFPVLSTLSLVVFSRHAMLQCTFLPREVCVVIHVS